MDKERIKRIIGIILIIAGVGCIVASIYFKKSTEYEAEKRLEEFRQELNQATEESTQATTELLIAMGEAESVSEPTSEPTTQKSYTLDGSTIAIMEIPKISLVATVSEGTDVAALRYSLGHFKGTAMAGHKGNFCVAGHRNYVYGSFFNRLNEVEIGDEIRVESKEGKFSYIVDEIKVVEPTEVSVLDPTEDYTITLVTCTPINTATHRLIIKGHMR